MNRFYQFLSLVVTAVILTGCASGGATVRSYIADKERVDQDLDVGNAGYLVGGPPEGAAEPERKKTRKIYVLEVSSVAPEVDTTTSTTEVTRTGTAVEEEPAPAPVVAPVVENREEPPARRIVIPDLDEVDVDEPAAASGAATTYTVQKNDTLQKISKKFYNSYSKWPKIYDANRDQLDNPNKLKPGMVIQIPAL